MPFSNPSEVDARHPIAQQPQTTLQGRYILRRCMADSALGKLHWAQDLQKTQTNGEQANLFIFLINPILTQVMGFEAVLKQVLPTYQRPVAAMPFVMDNGTHHDGTRWYAIQNTGGMLISERLQELDERGMPVPETFQLLEKLTQALAQFRPDGVFGYLEPATTLLSHEGICLLNSPVVSALRLLQTGKHEVNLPTLHSGYISPEVLLGHLPLASDDTFSIACLAYQLFKGETPYGKYSTLEAAVRNVFPTSTRKLRQEAWNVLQQGLSLQRVPRPATPTAFLRTLQRKQTNRLLVPISAAAAVSTLALAGYFIASSWNKPEPVPATALAPLTETAPPATSPTTDATNLPPPQTLNNANPTPPAIANSDNTPETTAKPAATGNTDNPEIQTLLQQANAEIHRGNLLSQNDKPAALDYLRKIHQQDPNNNEAKTLLTQLVDDQQAEAETLLSTGQVDAANTLLNRTDNLITEFTLHDSLKRQVTLESQVEQAKRNPNTELATAAAAGLGAAATGLTNTTATPTTTAVTTLNSNLDPSDWAGQAKAAQEQALSYLKKGKTVEARPHLDASQALIVQHNLEKLVEEQLALEQRFRETRDNMGIFAADHPLADTHKKVSPPKTSKQDLTTNTTNTTAKRSDSAEQSKKTTNAGKEVNTKDTAKTGTREANRDNSRHTPPETVTTRTAAPQSVRPVPTQLPIEFDIPTQTRPASVTPPARPSVAVQPRPQPSHITPAKPVPTRANNPAVPELMEVPLDMIKNKQ